MLEAPPPLPAVHCRSCRTEVLRQMLACPGCGALVHAEELKRLATAAQQAPPSEALGLWREAMALLPAESSQSAVIAKKVEALSRLVETQPKTGGAKWKGVTTAGRGSSLVFSEVQNGFPAPAGAG